MHNPVQYVGSTSKPANVRLGQHVGTVTFQCHNDTTCPVGEHFRGKGHGAHHMEFLVIEKVDSRDKHVLEARERYWRKQYNAISKGLNKNAT